MAVWWGGHSASTTMCQNSNTPGAETALLAWPLPVLQADCSPLERQAALRLLLLARARGDLWQAGAGRVCRHPALHLAR